MGIRVNVGNENVNSVTLIQSYRNIMVKTIDVDKKLSLQ